MLSAATVAVWAVSYRVGYEVGFKTRETVSRSAMKEDLFEYSSVVANGRVWLWRRRGTNGMPQAIINNYPARVGQRFWVWRFVDVRGFEPEPFWEWLGFHREHQAWTHQGNVDAVDEFVIPLWIIVTLFAALPATVVWRPHRAKARSGFEIEVTRAS